MYYVYVLKSELGEHFYIGQTTNLLKRICLHNNKQVVSTKRYTPWSLIHSEEFTTRTESVAREKYLKSHAGRKWLKGMGQ